MIDAEKWEIVDGLLNRCRDYVSLDMILVRCNNLKEKEGDKMKEIRIIAKREKGEKALRKHWEESMKLGKLHKFTFKKMGFKQTVIKEKPFTVLLEVRNRYFQTMLKAEKFIEEIQKAMKLNGASKSDYNLVVKE